MPSILVCRIEMIRSAQNKIQLQLSAANYMEYYTIQVLHKRTKSSVGIGDIAEVLGTRPYDQTRWLSVFFLPSLLLACNIPPMSNTTSSAPSQERINYDIVTLTRFLTEGQTKHKEATGDFTYNSFSFIHSLWVTKSAYIWQPPLPRASIFLQVHSLLYPPSQPYKSHRSCRLIEYHWRWPEETRRHR